VNKAELTAALAMRTKMSKADASRTIEALFDDKGHHRGRAEEGREGPDHRLREFRRRASARPGWDATRRRVV